jgi:hypothetical protein
MKKIMPKEGIASQKITSAANYVITDNIFHVSA